MTGCEKYLDMISLYIDGELDGDKTSELLAHTASCPHCAALLRIYEEAFDGGDSEIAKPPAELAANVMVVVKSMPAPRTEDSTPQAGETPPHSRKRKHGLFSVRVRGIVAAAAVLIVAMTIYLPSRITDISSSGEANGANYYEAESTPSGSAAQFNVGKSAESDELVAEDQIITSAESTAGGGTFYSADALLDYYAVVNISGELPELLDGYGAEPYGDGEYLIIIPAELTEELESLGYTVEYSESGESSTETAVIHTP